jgi:hypothetical protein
LMKLGFPVHSYGKCLNNKHAPDTVSGKVNVLRSHLFSLAFENSNVHDYVTEKYFQSLSAGSIPVYFGAPNIKDFAPTDDPSLSLIDVSNIVGTAKAKALKISKILTKLMNNKVEYEKMLAWKFKTEVQGGLARVLKKGEIGSNCRLCMKLKETMQKGLTSAPTTQKKRPR